MDTKPSETISALQRPAVVPRSQSQNRLSVSLLYVLECFSCSHQRKNALPYGGRCYHTPLTTLKGFQPWIQQEPFHSKIVRVALKEELRK